MYHQHAYAWSGNYWREVFPFSSNKGFRCAAKIWDHLRNCRNSSSYNNFYLRRVVTVSLLENKKEWKMKFEFKLKELFPFDYYPGCNFCVPPFPNPRLSASEVEICISIVPSLVHFTDD